MMAFSQEPTATSAEILLEINSLERFTMSSLVIELMRLFESIDLYEDKHLTILGRMLYLKPILNTDFTVDSENGVKTGKNSQNLFPNFSPNVKIRGKKCEFYPKTTDKNNIFAFCYA